MPNLTLLLEVKLLFFLDGAVDMGAVLRVEVEGLVAKNRIGVHETFS